MLLAVILLHILYYTLLDLVIEMDVLQYTRRSNPEDKIEG
jgi:hypothetical protein